MPVLFDKNIAIKYLSLLKSDPYHRYLSWDFCYREFTKENRSESHSLSLAFYLASWGMYRGSGGLLQKNHRIHEGAVEIIYSPKYNPLRCSLKQEVSHQHIPLILELRDAIAKHYNAVSFIRKGESKKLTDTDTLLSKVLLGTTGCVPAYDRYFVTGLKVSNFKKSIFDDRGMKYLFDFVDENIEHIMDCQKMAKEITNCYYPRMKIVDMYFWQLGFDADAKNNK